MTLQAAVNAQSVVRTVTQHSASAKTPRSRYLWRSCAAFIWAASALLLWLGATTLCAERNCKPPQIDLALLTIMHESQQPWLTTFFATITWLGSILVLLPVALVLARRLKQQGHRRAAHLLPLAVCGAWLWAHISKLLVARPRPDLYAPLINMPSDLSFPSAHAMQISAFALALMLAPGLRGNRAALFAAVLLVIMVALSRLYLQVHFPSDVVIGLIAGAGWVIGLHLWLEAYR